MVCLRVVGATLSKEQLKVIEDSNSTINKEGYVECAAILDTTKRSRNRGKGRNAPSSDDLLRCEVQILSGQTHTNTAAKIKSEKSAININHKLGHMNDWMQGIF